MDDHKTEALSRVPMFAASSGGDLKFLASRADEVDAEAGRTLIHEGAASDTFFILLEGEASVSVGGQSRPDLRAGDFFGELSMLDRGPATATVVTKTPAKLLVMSHAQFRDAIKSNDALLSTVMGAVATRLRRDSLNQKV